MVIVFSKSNCFSFKVVTIMIENMTECFFATVLDVQPLQNVIFNDSLALLVVSYLEMLQLCCFIFMITKISILVGQQLPS